MALFHRCCPSLSFLLELVAVVAFARGLLYCCGRATRGYYVCNPATTTWTALPPPGNDHGTDPAVALVFDEPGVYNFHADYRVVCAYPIAGGSCDGIYGFETFSSAAWNWATSAEIFVAERILFGSGVAAGGKAYWRTTMEEVVAYDPVGRHVDGGRFGGVRARGDGGEGKLHVREGGVGGGVGDG